MAEILSLSVNSRNRRAVEAVGLRLISSSVHAIDLNGPILIVTYYTKRARGFQPVPPSFIQNLAIHMLPSHFF